MASLSSPGMKSLLTWAFLVLLSGRHFVASAPTTGSSLTTDTSDESLEVSAEEPDTPDAEEPDTPDAEEPDTPDAEEPDTPDAEEADPADAQKAPELRADTDAAGNRDPETSHNEIAERRSNDEERLADLLSENGLSSRSNTVTSLLSPKIAVATVYQAAVTPTTLAGYIVFYQAKPLQAVRVAGSLSLAAAPANLRVEIHTNSDITNSCANSGRVYNPLGVTDGGIVLRSGATVSGTTASFFTDDRSLFQLTLYGDTSALSRSVVVYDGANAVACGSIQETTP